MEYFARRQGFGNITGIDRSPQQVAAARSLGLTGVREGEVLEVLETLKAASQGLVIAFDLLEHFTKDELLVLVDRVARVLTTGGKFLIHVPNGESPFGGRVRYADFTHELAFTRESLSQLLNACGFSQIHCYEDLPGAAWDTEWRPLADVEIYSRHTEMLSRRGDRPDRCGHDLQPKSTLRCG